jgi:hypothetical protein
MQILFLKVQALFLIFVDVKAARMGMTAGGVWAFDA